MRGTVQPTRSIQQDVAKRKDEIAEQPNMWPQWSTKINVEVVR